MQLRGNLQRQNLPFCLALFSPINMEQSEEKLHLEITHDRFNISLRTVDAYTQIGEVNSDSGILGSLRLYSARPFLQSFPPFSFFLFKVLNSSISFMEPLGN